MTVKQLRQKHKQIHKYHVAYKTFCKRLELGREIDRAIQTPSQWHGGARYTKHNKEDWDYYHNYTGKKKTKQLFVYYLEKYGDWQKAIDKIKL